MTLLTVVQDVCAVVGVGGAALPTSVFSNLPNNRTMQEMLSLANEMAQRISYDTREWTKLQAQLVCTGDGTATVFPLPANYKRMLMRANMWRSTSAQQPMCFIPNPDEWLQRRASNYTDAWGEWHMIGGGIEFWPALNTGETARCMYLQKNCIALASGGFGDRFQGDNDTYVLDERVLKLGMIWQWKAQKGSPYAEDLGTYDDAVAMLQGADQPAPIIVGRKPVSVSARVAYPFPVPTP